MGKLVTSEGEIFTILILVTAGLKRKFFIANHASSIVLFWLFFSLVFMYFFFFWHLFSQKVSVVLKEIHIIKVMSRFSNITKYKEMSKR